VSAFNPGVKGFFVFYSAFGFSGNMFMSRNVLKDIKGRRSGYLKISKLHLSKLAKGKAGSSGEW